MTSSSERKKTQRNKREWYSLWDGFSFNFAFHLTLFLLFIVIDIVTSIRMWSGSMEHALFWINWICPDILLANRNIISRCIQIDVTKHGRNRDVGPYTESNRKNIIELIYANSEWPTKNQPWTSYNVGVVFSLSDSRLFWKRFTTKRLKVCRKYDVKDESINFGYSFYIGCLDMLYSTRY